MQLTLFISRSAREKLLLNLEVRNYVYDHFNVVIIEDPLYSNDTRKKIHGWVNLNHGLMASVEFDETNYRTVLRQAIGDPVYNYDLILQYVVGLTPRTYCLKFVGSDKVFHTFQASGALQATEYARAYMSSWDSVRIRTTEEYEQEQTGN